MGTKEFNLLDKLIAKMRLGKVLPYIHGNEVILDFGCGHQAYLLSLSKDKIKKGIGIDYDGEQRKIGSNIEVLNFQFKDKLPFGDKLFDSIFSLAVIEHLEPKDANLLFREFSRILKPGGKIVITTPTPIGKVILEFMAFRLGIISRKEVADHKKYYSKEDMAKLAKDYGLKTEKYETFQFGGNSLCVLSK